MQERNSNTVEPRLMEIPQTTDTHDITNNSELAHHR